MCIHTLRINCHKSQLCSQTYGASYVSHTHVCKADEHSLNIQTHVVRPNNREAIHATSNRDNSAPDAAPNHSYALVQANLGKADISAPDAAPNHSSANKADDRALYTNMWSSSNGRNMELCLP